MSSPAVLHFNGAVSELTEQSLVSSWDSASPEIEFDPKEGTPLDLEEVFGRRAPLVVEIGTGNGTYLAAEAERNPGKDFIGIERSGEFFTKAKKRVIRHGLTNARCIRAEAEDVFAAALPPVSVAAVVSNFSDPWPKRRHRKRRVFRPPFLSLIERVLVAGGKLSFKSDVGWYFNLTISQFRCRSGWRILSAGPIAESAGGAERAVTNYEMKAREVGSEVWGFVAVWDGGTPRGEHGEKDGDEEGDKDARGPEEKNG